MPAQLIALAHAIARREGRVIAAVRAVPELAKASLTDGATRSQAKAWFLEEIAHYVYAGDTLLHVAAAAYAVDLAKALLEAGADVHASNRRGAQPLHYAADGGPQLRTWDPRAQAKVVAALLAAGANPNALDKSGVAPLHRAVRTRCTGAVRALLEGGADPRLRNKSGTTPLELARMTTGRGGSSAAEARREQASIVTLLTRSR